ncbi:MAG: glycosyltransferase [Chloroflexi bacterium]|nr:MAG: glycosyltransferase [Chloroflexota bacterium]
MADFPAELTALPRANVLGVGVHAIDLRTAIDAIETAIFERRRGYVCLTGVHGVMEAQREPDLMRIFSMATLVLPDGMPTVWMGHLQGFREMDRVFGPDLLITIAERSAWTEHSHFLCGGQVGVAEQLRNALLCRFPTIRILGTYTPPFRPLTRDEEKTFISAVNELAPDIIWVGMSTPKQERFMAEYLPHLNTTLMIGVGAAFDFHTGRIKDSPQWVKHSGLQWAHRLMQQPARLWKRYILNNPMFLVRAGLQLTGLKRYYL